MTPFTQKALAAAVGIAVLAVFIAYVMEQRSQPTVTERLRYSEAAAEGEPALHAAEGSTPELPHAGQIYVPAYSHAYSGDGSPVLFAVTLSIRNVDTAHTIRITRVDYHGTDGTRVRSFLRGPRTLAPLATAEYFVSARDEAGGSGANFIVEWSSQSGAQRPETEAVMLGSMGPTGFAFSSAGIHLLGSTTPPTEDASAEGARSAGASPEGASPEGVAPSPEGVAPSPAP